jgi:hypothetical protein
MNVQGNEIREVEYMAETAVYSGGFFRFSREMIIHLKNGLSYELRLQLSGQSQTWDCQTYKYPGYFQGEESLPSWLKTNLKEFLKKEWESRADSHLQRSIMQAIK